MLPGIQGRHCQSSRTRTSTKPRGAWGIELYRPVSNVDGNILAAARNNVRNCSQRRADRGLPNLAKTDLPRLAPFRSFYSVREFIKQGRRCISGPYAVVPTRAAKGSAVSASHGPAQPGSIRGPSGRGIRRQYCYRCRRRGWPDANAPNTAGESACPTTASCVLAMVWQAEACHTLHEVVFDLIEQSLLLRFILGRQRVAQSFEQLPLFPRQLGRNPHLHMDNQIAPAVPVDVRDSKVL